MEIKPKVFKLTGIVKVQQELDIKKELLINPGQLEFLLWQNLKQELLILKIIVPPNQFSKLSSLPKDLWPLKYIRKNN